VAVTNGYATRNQIKAALRIGTADDTDDTLIDDAAGAASRLIDGYCNRAFWSVGTVTRVFAANDPYFCDVDDFSGTAITLKTSTQENGTFDLTWAVTDWQLEPLNANLDGLTWAYSKIKAVGSNQFPFTGTGEALVQLTASFGWTAVPETVTQATIIQASRLFKRLDSPLGVAGFGDMGAIRVSRFLDPDVQQLVDSFRKLRYLV